MKAGNTRKSSAAGRYRRAAKPQKMEKTKNATSVNRQMTLFENQIWEQNMPKESNQAIKTNQNNGKQIYRADISNQPDNVIRLGVKNVHGFPDRGDHVKFDALQEESVEHGHGYNIQSFMETNKRWNILALEKKLPELTKEWWEKASYQLAWLRDDDAYHQQYGGVATVIDKILRSCKYKSGNDKMGRWTWLTF